MIRWKQTQFASWKQFLDELAEVFFETVTIAARFGKNETALVDVFAEIVSSVAVSTPGHPRPLR